jgi:hypothetical protein
MTMRGQDTNRYQNISEHFAPNNSMISYLKLRNLVKHQINEYEKVQRGIEEDALYYVYSEPDTVKDYQMLSEKIEEWQWFLDSILDDELKINAITL